MDRWNLRPKILLEDRRECSGVLVEEGQFIEMALMRGENDFYPYAMPMKLKLDLSSLSSNHVCGRREEMSQSRRRSGIQFSRSSYGRQRESWSTIRASIVDPADDRRESGLGEDLHLRSSDSSRDWRTRAHSHHRQELNQAHFGCPGQTKYPVRSERP